MDTDFLDEHFATAVPDEGKAGDDPITPADLEGPSDNLAASDGPQRDEKGRFAATKGVEPETDTVPPTDKLPKEDYKAIREEREKRQRLEAELEALKQQFQSFQKPQEPAPPPPTLWEDEQGWQQHLQAQVLKQADQLSRINASEMAARAQHADFGEMYDLFNDLAGQNPAIVQQAMADPHPWGKAYQIAKSHKSMQELGAVDVADLEAKIEARVREQLAAEQAAQPQPATVPQSLADAQSSRRVASAPVGPMTLEKILGL